LSAGCSAITCSRKLLVLTWTVPTSKAANKLSVPCQQGGEKRGPVGPADTGPCKQCESGGRDQRTHYQRSPGAVAIERSARPARQQEHQQNEWQQSGSRFRRLALGGKGRFHQLVRSSGPVRNSAPTRHSGVVRLLYRSPALDADRLHCGFASRISYDSPNCRAYFIASIAAPRAPAVSPLGIT